MDDQSGADHFRPAARFVESQMWWLASELARRGGRLVVESWPLDGFYHGLAVVDARSRSFEEGVFFNVNGTIQVHPPHVTSRFHWDEELLEDSPHDVIRRIERAAGWSSPIPERTSSQTLVYRVIARALAERINDRAGWHAWSLASIPRDELGGRLASGRLRAGDILGALHNDPAKAHRFWALFRRNRRDPAPALTVIAVFDDAGVMYCRDDKLIDLFSIYTATRSLGAVMSKVYPQLDD